MAPWRAKFPKMQAFTKLNNAEILQLKTYFTDFDTLEDRFKDAGSLTAFIHYLQSVKQSAEEKNCPPNEIYRLPFTHSNEK